MLMWMATPRRPVYLLHRNRQHLLPTTIRRMQRENLRPWQKDLEDLTIPTFW